MENDIREVIARIIGHFGLKAEDFRIERIGSGYINFTYKLAGTQRSYILQRVNNNVFRKPEVIASNLRIASEYLHQKFPDYLFLTAVKSQSGEEMVYDEEGFPWRLFPFFENTYTVDRVLEEHEAYCAAAEFGKLTRNLDGVDTRLFQPTIERFHDLDLRYRQFETSVKNAPADRLQIAQEEVKKCQDFQYLVTEHNDLIRSGKLKLRITHNDTKINNVLFDGKTKETVCAIDLDTLMPGYFIYDVGDMIRTFVSPVDEEERDLQKIVLRESIYQALVNGYLSQMNDTLTLDEKMAIPFSGMMMTYIMALRMLADYLNGNVYYVVRYEDQNLVRAKNQLRLLEELKKMR